MNGDVDIQILLRKLQDSLVESTVPRRDTYEAGGFIVMLTPNDPLVWINYAVPVSLLTPNGVNEMISVFRSYGRSPRLEFFVDLWPELPAELEAHGLICEKRMPVMVLAREDWRGHVHNLDARKVGPAEVGKLNPALAEAFGMLPANEEDGGTEKMASSIIDGRALAAMVVIDGQVAGGGYAVGTATVREIAGIGTREPYRRRGVASATIANLLDRFFGGGGEVAWLTPGDNSSQTVYARLGFRPVGEQVCYQMSG